MPLFYLVDGGGTVNRKLSARAKQIAKIHSSDVNKNERGVLME
jgi:hypothetical protein